MRVLLDTNVLLSYPLAPSAVRTITTLVSACWQHDQIELLIPEEQLDEFVRKASAKRYFRTRIPRSAIDAFAAQLRLAGQVLPLVDVPPAHTRDRKDDYLVAYAIIYDADYLVSGDRDLLVLGQVGSLQIVTPAAFVQELLRRGWVD